MTKTASASLNQVVPMLRDLIAESADPSEVPGYLGGVYHRGEQVVIAHGTANTATGAAMTEDTGFLVGSITKVMTTTLVLRSVERGELDLDERVVSYLPDFKLSVPGNADEILVRHLITHSDGIDADVYFPIAAGREALRVYVDGLSDRGTLFTPGEYVSYSNPGFNVAGRVLEVVTGRSYHDLLEREIYAPVGMVGSSTSAEQAILRRTAVGHFSGPDGPRACEMFMLPETWSAAGSTPIVTIADLLAFARSHLSDGITPSGVRVLSAESAQLMRSQTMDMDTPNVPPIGLGWWLLPIGETTCLWHGGGSPGGSSNLVVIPEHDFAVASFGNGPRARDVHDRFALALIRDHLGITVPDLFSPLSAAPPDLAPYEGTYRSHQIRADVTVVDGQLQHAAAFEPMDDSHRRILDGFSGGVFPGPPQRLAPVGDRLFASADMPLDSFNGLGRLFMVSFHGTLNGHARYRSTGARLAPWDGAL